MFKMEIKGLDKLQRDLEDAQKAMQNLDGELGKVAFNPEDPASIEAAIQEVDRVIDDRIGGYADNPFVRPVVEEAKERYRQAILDRAASARLEQSED